MNISEKSVQLMAYINLLLTRDEEEGAVGMEYALLAAVVVIAIITALKGAFPGSVITTAASRLNAFANS